MRKTIASLVVAVCALVAMPAGAACTWEWDCSNGPGQCRRVPLCDNALDLPPIDTPSTPPIPAPSVRPIPAPNLPPLGTRSCQPRYICGPGQCAWQTVCD